MFEACPKPCASPSQRALSRKPEAPSSRRNRIASRSASWQPTPAVQRFGDAGEREPPVDNSHLVRSRQLRSLGCEDDDALPSLTLAERLKPLADSLRVDDQDRRRGRDPTQQRIRRIAIERDQAFTCQRQSGDQRTAQPDIFYYQHKQFSGGHGQADPVRKFGQGRISISDGSVCRG